MTGGAVNSENSSAWLELESDPGLFTLLIDDFGVKGVQVEEIYDLSKTLESSIFGFIFLFKWMEKRGKRNKASTLDPNSYYVTDPNIVNKMFFAHQIVPNSCATHALLSILLNCKSTKYFDLGELLTKFQRLCDGLSPENKGFAIGNQPKLADAHNSYAKPENQSSLTTNHINDSPYATSSSTPSSSIPQYSSTSSFNYQSSQISSGYSTSSSLSKTVSAGDCASSGAEIFHFICFVPIDGRLYELDGLKPHPVDHGPVSITDPTNNWTNKFKSIIRHRLSSFNNGQQNHEIRFNLMALVPDKMIQLSEQIDIMKYNHSTITSLLIEARCLCLNENDLNVNCVKKEPEQLMQIIKKETDFVELNKSELPDSGSSDSKPNTRQLRSSRNNAKEITTNNENKNELFELNFVLPSSDIEDKKKSLADLCKLHVIESIKMTVARSKHEIVENCMPIDPKEKENDIINKIKMRLNSSNENLDLLKERFGEKKNIDLINEKSVMFKKSIDIVGLKSLEVRLSSEIETEEARYNEELEKRKKYKTDALRRKHVYDEFIVTYLKILNENGKLAELIRSNKCPIVNNNLGNSMFQAASRKRKKKEIF